MICVDLRRKSALRTAFRLLILGKWQDIVGEMLNGTDEWGLLGKADGLFKIGKTYEVLETS